MTAAKTTRGGPVGKHSDKGTFGAIWEAYENYHVALLCVGVTGAFVSGGFSAGILFLLGWEEIRSFAHGISLFWNYLRAVAPLSAAAFFYVFVSLELQRLANVWIFGGPLVLGSWIAERIAGPSYQSFWNPFTKQYESHEVVYQHDLLSLLSRYWGANTLAKFITSLLVGAFVGCLLSYALDRLREPIFRRYGNPIAPP